MKQKYYFTGVVALLLIACSVLPMTAQAQTAAKNSGGGNQECEDFGLRLIAKFEWSNGYVFEKPAGNEDIVTLDGDATSADWESTEYISGIIVKGSNDAEKVTIDPPSLSGTITNGGLPGTPDISNVKFCAPDSSECIDGAPRMAGQDILDEDDRTITNTIVDDDGVKELRFTLLENVEVASVTGSGGESFSANAEGDVWTWTGDEEDTPTEVTYVLQATSDSGRYFVVAEDDCGLVTNFDPPFTIESGFANQSALEGSYPNPFRTQTTVQFHLEAPAPTTLTVYDVMGRRVATLVEGSLQAGPHEAVWNGRASDGSTLASGVYFVRLEAGDRVQTRRITLIK